MYNARDYAEGRSRPSGRLARCTYKGAIEMCSHSESPGRQAGRLAGGWAGEALHLQLLGEDGGAETSTDLQWFSAVSKKEGRKAMGLLAQSSALHLALHKFAY